MAQIYKVYINDKEIIFADSENIVNEDDKTEKLVNPPEAEIKKIIADFNSNENLRRLFLIAADPQSLFRSFRKDYKMVKAAGGFVRDKDRRILMIFRRGKWDLPKGKIDGDERRKHAALREVREETGLKNLLLVRRIDRTYHVYTEKNDQILKKTYWYEMAAIDVAPLVPQADEDITDIRWFEPDEIDDVYPNTYTLIKRILEQFK
ncbi:MAG TPA: NUDIX domain-containing protein [Bacteroidales bacterium]|nr:NUDIX domain-containing protein [Bacteroidales bacterium]